MRKLLVFFVLAILCSTTADAQWRRGGLHGADVRALIADPSDPDTLYLGTSSGEVYVSNDGAKTWLTPRNGAPFPGYIVDNLVVDREGRLWAASWGLWGGGVIAVSEDRGKTWSRRDSGLEDFSVRAIAIDSKDSDFVVVGGLTGVYRSSDSGRSWTKISDQENVESLAIDPRTNDRIYVGTWRQGIRTDDGGKSWKAINQGMVLDTDMFSITIDEQNPDNMWASTCGWVYNTGDRGDNWTRYRDGFNNRRIHDIELDPCNKETIYAGSVAGLYRSEDKGKNWYVVSDEEMVINSIVLHPQRPNRIILGVEGDGVYVSNDRAKTFTRTSDGLHNLRITTIVSDPAAKSRVYAAVAFGGAASGIYRSDDAGNTWSRWSKTRLPEVLSLQVEPSKEADVHFIAGTEKGFFWSVDGRDWQQSEPANFPIRVEKIVRFNNTRAFAATAEGVFTTRDAGKSWYRLSGADSRTVDIALGRHAGKRALFALNANGVSMFDGERWAPVEGAPAKGRTLAARALPDGDVLFVAGVQGIRAGRIDADRKWQPVDAPDAQYASVLADGPSTDPLLFVTSRAQREVLVGLPNDPEWRELVLPLRDVDVTSVVPDPYGDRFYVGTVGGGVFVYEGKIAKYAGKKAVDTAAAYLGSAGSK